jgi:hypothetical protein
VSELSYEHRIVGSNRKIDPTRRAHLKADLTPDDNDRVEIGPTQLAFDEWQAAGIVPPDLPALRAYRYSVCKSRFANMIAPDYYCLIR